MRTRRVIAIVLAGLVLSSCEPIYGPTAPTGDWSTHDAARFTVYARPGSFADANAGALIEQMDDQYTSTQRVLDLPAGPRLSVFLYNRGAEIAPPLPEARAGVAFPETNALHAVAAAPLDNDLRTLLSHEVNHLVVQAGLGGPGTSFMNEGLASALVSERFGLIGRTAVHKWVRDHRSALPALTDLIDDSKWSSNSHAGYQTSASFLAFLLERYGAAPLKRLYYARSADFATRVEAIYGKPLAALADEWLAAI